jgi:hypothetical protein
VIRELLRFRRQRREPIPVTFEEYGGSNDMLGYPGCMRIWYETDARAETAFGTRPVRKADVCCPGCAQAVFNLPEDQYPLNGSLYTLSCPTEVHAKVCCGWTGYLRDGYWVPERSKIR